MSAIIVAQDELIGLPTAADILRVNPATVWRWIDQGTLQPAARVVGRGGKRTRYFLYRADVERLAQERTAA